MLRHWWLNFDSVGVSIWIMNGTVIRVRVSMTSSLAPCRLSGGCLKVSSTFRLIAIVEAFSGSSTRVLMDCS